MPLARKTASRIFLMLSFPCALQILMYPKTPGYINHCPATLCYQNERPLLKNAQYLYPNVRPNGGTALSIRPPLTASQAHEGNIPEQKSKSKEDGKGSRLDVSVFLALDYKRLIALCVFLIVPLLSRSHLIHRDKRRLPLPVFQIIIMFCRRG
jgi:hypothetical protein